MKVNILDVAKKAGVSPATVSNVRTGKKNVTPELVKRVNDAIAELNYIPNTIASGLRANTTNIIGVVLPSFHHPFHVAMLKGIQDVAINTNYSVCAFPTCNKQEIEHKCLLQLKSIMPDAILISSYAMEDNEDGLKCLQLLEEFSANSTPVISLERNMDHIPGVRSIYYDSRQPSYNIVEYLIRLGHKKIAYIGGPKDFDISSQRMLGYMQAMEDNHLEVKPQWIYDGAFEAGNGYENTKKLLNQTPSVSAIFCGNDEIAIGAVKAIHELNIKIPSDIAIIGFDNIYVSTLIDPPLTTVGVPAYEIGKLAIETAFALLKNPREANAHSMEINTKIVKRKSTELNRSSTWNIHISNTYSSDEDETV